MTTIRLLTFSTLFPNNARPNHGVFVENRLRHLVASGEATSEVLAPVPWFPSANPRFGDWAVNARVVRREVRQGLTVWHPRFPVIPRFGMSLAPSLLYRAMRPVVRRMLAEGPGFDAIDAHGKGVVVMKAGERAYAVRREEFAFVEQHAQHAAQLRAIDNRHQASLAFARHVHAGNVAGEVGAIDRKPLERGGGGVLGAL